MPRPTLQSPHARSPRSNLVSSSYDTRNLPNPFQDTSSTRFASKKNLSVPATAPEASDTIPSSSFASASISTASSSDRSRAPPLRHGNSSSNLLLPNDQTKSDSSTLQQLYREGSRPSNTQLQQQQQQQQTNDRSLSRQQRDSNFAREHESDHEQGHDLEQENPLIYLTASQREAAVENLEIETMDRTQKLRASIGVLTNSLRFRSEAEFNRLPAAIRTMTVEEFWFTYNGSAKEYLEQQTAKKSVANTSFLRALGITDPKKKRETMGQSEESWRHKQKNEEGVERTSQSSARYKPYPGTGQSQPRHIARPFVDSRLGQSSNE
ncbi:hypothetical protein BGZ80_011489 [Entomortierella chlamydospora]|uniref:Borealin N-terminal domain-containing protein n=1 Tax=Entomortierella chlamydospora TaxID=101097 RepID=A0A9P6N3V9_9FUNG|nr:hypothetical protein BGZ79_004638 [Entomortierella chlamydospora]KAG0022677.1 hypothetical protein BGZ80_011489 [Entomortierella chlamydospora]